MGQVIAPLVGIVGFLGGLGLIALAGFILYKIDEWKERGQRNEY